jgi:hypothetical protein
LIGLDWIGLVEVDGFIGLDWLIGLIGLDCLG